MAGFVLAYDISRARRRARVARLFEKRAVRLQKSVFFFEGTAREMEALLDEAATHIHPRTDCVQAWRLAGDEGPRGAARGFVLHPRPRCAIITASEVQRIGEGP